MKSAESAVAQDDRDAVDHELAAWREEIRGHALGQLGRKPAKPPRLLRIGTLVLLLLVHAVALIGLREAMRSPPAASESAVAVIFLNADLREPPLPVPSPPTPHPAAVVPHSVAHAVAPATASAAPVQTPADTPVLPQLFNTDGSIRMPSQSSSPSPPTPQQLSAELMQRGHNILHCRQSRFARGYKRDESVGDGIARKYLVWIGLYNAEYAERKAALREAEAAAACDG